MLETLFSIFSDLLITWTICRKMEWKNHVESCLNMTQMGIASHWLNMLQDHAAMLQISEKIVQLEGGPHVEPVIHHGTMFRPAYGKSI